MLAMEHPSFVLEQARAQQQHRTLLPPVYLGDFRTALYRAMPNVRYHSCPDDGGIAHLFIIDAGAADSWVVWWQREDGSHTIAEAGPYALRDRINQIAGDWLIHIATTVEIAHIA
ncbi:hypothetical protein [Saccharopolyspora spinosa]|uniref:Uncharacterized protein n=1 Tax=Saccharopolyspora spinosa TaxID=60894 RepID=A0A2N3Y763_SACSN|nr:hypothetical protein [Saccharopolyspora spinosa]PKW18728.1 hypothetical protein A8926_6853 [Saccharopolyspora spinosa]